MQSLEGMLIVLTGAGGGIGREIAKQLDKAGAQLILTDINSEAIHNLNASLAEKHHTVIADLSSAEGRRALLVFCEDLMTGPQLLINVAGINRFAALENIDDDALDRLVSINLTSQIALCRDFLPLLKRQKQAAIVNLGSILGSIGMPGYSVYSATKFGLRGFSEALNRELMDSSVSVRYFAPRATTTALNDDRVNEMNKALGNAMDSPELVASQLLDFIRTSSPRAYLGWPEKLFVRINSLLPALVDQSFRKQLNVIKRFF
jgi:short-subunit dehydrogenase